MIKYVQNKSINYKEFQKILEASSESNQFTNRGPAKLMLEKRLSEILNIADDKRVLCTANGTLALHAIIMYLKRRDKNIKAVSPSFTFPSCVVSTQIVDLVDIDRETYTMPLSDENIKNYDCFIITNLFGTYPKNIDKWINSCKKSGKVIIFDNASSPMTTIDGNNFCNLGDFSFGSLHHTKYLGFAEGGFIVLPKEDYVEFEEILGFGFKENSLIRTYNSLSSNFKISDVSAASILQHINSYDMEAHRHNQKIFLERLSDIHGAEPFNYAKGVVFGNMPILFKDKADIDFFRENKIEVQKYYYPLRKDHINSNNLFSRIINFPMSAYLKESDIIFMCSKISEYLK